MGANPSIQPIKIRLTKRQLLPFSVPVPSTPGIYNIPHFLLSVNENIDRLKHARLY